MSFHATLFSSLDSHHRWDPEYFGEEFSLLRSALVALGSRPLKDWVSGAARGVGPLYDPNGEVRVINSINVRELQISNERMSRVSRSQLDAFPMAVVRPFDIVITSTGIGTLGRAFCNVTEETFFADGHITVLRLKDPDAGPHICSFLQSPLGRAQFIQRRRGSSRQVEIYPEDILSVLVPPPLPRAEEIAAEWLSAVAEVAEASNLYPAAERELLDSLGWEELESDLGRNNYVLSLKSIVSAGRMDPEYYSMPNRLLEKRLSERNSVKLRECTSGYLKGIQPEAYDSEGSVVAIKTKDVTRAGISFGTCDRVRAEDIPDQGGTVCAGMLVMNMTGVGTLGRTAVVPEHEGRAVIAVDVSGWHINDLLPVEYLALFLNSAAGMRQTLRFQTGSSGQLHIYPEHVRELSIYVRRNEDGSIDDEWHAGLAKLVTRSLEGRSRAYTHLDNIKTHWLDAAGIRPIILRE
jgi:hypothetical protein